MDDSYTTLKFEQNYVITQREVVSIAWVLWALLSVLLQVSWCSWLLVEVAAPLGWDTLGSNFLVPTLLKLQKLLIISTTEWVVLWLLLNSLPLFFNFWNIEMAIARLSSDRCRGRVCPRTNSYEENNFFKQEQFCTKSLPILALQTKLTKIMKPIRELTKSVTNQE